MKKLIVLCTILLPLSVSAQEIPCADTVNFFDMAKDYEFISSWNDMNDDKYIILKNNNEIILTLTKEINEKLFTCILTIGKNYRQK